MSLAAAPSDRPRLFGAAMLCAAAAIGAAAVAHPAIVVAAALGAAFVVLTLRSLAAGVAAFTVLIFLEQVPTISSSGVTFTKLAGGVLGVAWFAVIARRDAKVPFLAQRRPLLAYTALVLLCWTLASAVWAPDPHIATTTALRFGQGVLLLFIVFSAIVERRHLVWVLHAYIGGAVLTACIGLAGVTQAEGVGISSSDRLTGGIGDPNELAAILLPAVSFALFLLVTTRGALRRTLLLAAAFVCLIALFRTESRGGLAGLAVMLAAGVALAGPVRRQAVALVLAVAGLGLVYFTLIAPPEALSRVTAFSAGGGTGRTDLWTVAYDVTRVHPLAGVGAGNFPIVEPGYAFQNLNLPRFDLIVDTPKVVHNMYLNVLVELGIVGFVLFALLIGCAFSSAFGALRACDGTGDRETELLVRALLIGTIGMLAAFVFLSAQYEKELPLLLGLLAALPSVAPRVSPVTAVTVRHDDG